MYEYVHQSEIHSLIILPPINIKDTLSSFVDMKYRNITTVTVVKKVLLHINISPRTIFCKCNTAVYITFEEFIAYL